MESRNPLSNIKCRSIQIFNHQIKDNKAIYTIEIKLNNKQSIIITERYSELLNLHNAMSKEAKLPNYKVLTRNKAIHEYWLVIGIDEQYNIHSIEPLKDYNTVFSRIYAVQNVFVKQLM